MAGALLGIGQAGVGQAQQGSVRVLVDQIDLDQARPRRHRRAAVPAEAVGEAMHRDHLAEGAAGEASAGDIDEIEPAGLREPAAMIATLDAWFDRVAGAVHAFGGEVLKFIGDGLLAIFPVTGTPAEACDAALRAVVAARAGMAHLDKVRQAQGLAPLPFGAALHLGEMLWGNIGAADRLDFTAIGPAVNLVSRLEGLCRPLGRSVLISGAFAAETASPLVPLGEHMLSGIAT